MLTINGLYKRRNFMKQITLKIDGMMCGMCESHVNDCVRKSFNVKSVKSSHLKKETVVVCDDDINENDLKEAIEKTGYRVTDIKTEEYRKKGFLGLFGR